MNGSEGIRRPRQACTWPIAGDVPIGDGEGPDSSAGAGVAVCVRADDALRTSLD